MIICEHIDTRCDLIESFLSSAVNLNNNFMFAMKDG